MAEAVSASAVTTDDIAAARERKRQAEAAVEAYDDPQTIVDAYDDAMELLSTYEGSATGTGDFGAYLEFEDKFVTLAESLPDDIPTREAFEEANELLDRRRLSESHFEQAREILEPAREVKETLHERASAREHLRETRQAANRRLSTLEDEIAARERLVALGEADLDAPTARLHDPIEAYNDAVETAFRTYRREESARRLLALIDTATAYPLVDFDTPPQSLVDYLESNPVGTEPLPTVLEYADYSASKLSHYVDDAEEFRRRVATNETFLSRLDASPLTVSWPPPTAGHLRYLASELTAVVARFADESVVERARTVRDLTFRDDYERLRQSATARAELTDDERERLADGSIERELDSLREEQTALRSALDATDEA